MIAGEFNLHFRMNAALARQFRELETQRSAILQVWGNYRWEQLNQALPGEWSAHQVLAHIITAEKLSVRYMEKKILGIHETADANWNEAVRMLIFKVAQRLPLRYRAPARLVESTPSYPSLEAMVMDWEQVRTDLKNLLEKIRDEHVRRQIYKHPIAGMINIQHAMVFYYEHIHHHQKQLNRLLKALR